MIFSLLFVPAGDVMVRVSICSGDQCLLLPLRKSKILEMRVDNGPDPLRVVHEEGFVVPVHDNDFDGTLTQLIGR